MEGSYLFVLSAMLLLVGCYHYQPPDEVLLGTSFKSENRAATDRMLLEIKTLSLTKAKEIAELNNQSYQAAFHAVNSARMRYYQSLGAYSPEIYLGVESGQNSAWANSMVNPPMNLAGRDISFKVNSTVTASWLLFDGFARYLSTQIAKNEQVKEEAIKTRVLCMLKRSTAYAYFDIQLSEELCRIQNENIKFQQRLHRTVTLEEARKRRPEDEVLNFAVIAGIGEESLLAAINQRRIADFTLAQLMGYSEGMLPVELQIDKIPDEVDKIYYGVDLCIDTALKNSPDMHIMRQFLETARLNKMKSYSSFFPVIYADFQYGNLQMNSQYLDYRVNRSSYGQNSIYYGFHSELLLFNGLARYNAMREMQANFAVAQFSMAETYLQIINAIRSAYSGYETAYDQCMIYRNLLPQSLRQRDLVLERYLKYEASVDRLDKVQQSFVDIQTQYAVAKTDFQKSIAQLEAIMMIDVYTETSSENQ